MKVIAVLALCVALASAATKTIDLTTSSITYSVAKYEGWYTDANIKFCRGVEYDSTTQICCFGNLFDQGYTAITVDGTTNYGKSKVCCGASTTTETTSYNTTAFNGGNLIELKSCCGDSYVTVPDNKECCGGELVESKANSACCEGTYASNYFAGGVCCAGAWTNNTIADITCCPSEVQVANDGYEVNAGWTDGTWFFGAGAKVTAGKTYEATKEWCCNGEIKSSLDDGTAFFNDTSIKQFVCCDGGSFKSINPYLEFTCGSNYYNGGCTTYTKLTDLKQCVGPSYPGAGQGTVCDAKYAASIRATDCSASVGKGQGYNPKTQGRFNGDGGSFGDKSGAATAVVSLAALAGALAFLF